MAELIFQHKASRDIKFYPNCWINKVSLAHMSGNPEWVVSKQPSTRTRYLVSSNRRFLPRSIKRNGFVGENLSSILWATIYQEM